jgi:AAA domain
MDRPQDFKEILRKAKEQTPEAFVWPETADYLEFEKVLVTQPKPIIKNMLDCGSRILFGGGSKTFKTWLQCDLAVSIAAGAPWLGFETHQVRVLYVNLELKEYYMQRRLAEIRKARGISLGRSSLFVWNLRGITFSREQFVAELIDRCQHLEIGIVFIDPFYKLLNPQEDENSQTQMGAVLRCFDPLNKKEITTAFGIHFSKGNQAAKEPEDRISGAGTIARDADDIVTLTKHEEQLAFTMDFIIRDHPPIDSFVVKWDTPIMVRTDLDPAKIKKPVIGRRTLYDENDLLRVIATQDDELSSTQLETLAREQLGMVRSTFYQKLKILCNAKLAFKSAVTGNWNVKVR